jgi:signal transduction histidine kinase
MPTPLRTLIVENSEDDAILIADCLEQAGYRPECTRVESAEAMRLALGGPQGWDVILADYTMPCFSGMEALRIYQESGLDIPFLLVSGSIGEERAVEAMRAGVHDYVMKDRMRRLGAAVNRELREAANRRERRGAIDENARLNSVLLQLNKELRDKAALASRARADLEQVTWAASHDLKEPLRLVSTYTQLLLRRRSFTDPDEQEFARYIGEGVERVTALIDGLLAYARNLRPPVGEVSETDAEGVLKEVVETLRPHWERRGASLTAGPLPPVLVERGALVDVFHQLLLNALEFRREGVPAHISVTAESDAGMVRFAVKDNGIGIKPEHHERIFQLFRRLHGPEYAGIGVGLPLSKQVIENHGGRLWLESELGVGSTFYFTLPAASAVLGTAATANTAG